MGKFHFKRTSLPATLLSLLATGQAMAHHQPPGMEDIDEFAGEPFKAALTHPFSGADHWLAALAVGLILWTRGRTTGSHAGALFVLALVAGIATGRSGGQMPLMESGLAVSVLLAGCAVAGAAWFSNKAVLMLVALTGAWHGVAHGQEMPSGVPLGIYAAGLVVASAGIVLLAALLANQVTSRWPDLPRWAGGGLAAAGTCLLFAGLAS